MKDSKVAWTHHTWNPWLGCTEVSRECVGCYARDFIEQKGACFGTLRLTQTWGDPYRWNAEAGRAGRLAFCFASSMTDYFHEDADRWRDQAWRVIRDCKNLIWLLLTKRPERIEKHRPEDWDTHFNHCWLGTTCGCRRSYERVNKIREIPCSRRFLSIEPLLEDISDIDLTGISWVLVGGMSGPLWKDHWMKLQWAASLYDLTRSTNTPYFFKQIAAPSNEWGSNALGLYLAERDGREADPDTVDLVREYPDTPLPLMALDREKGHRLTAKHWSRYKLFDNSAGLKSAKPATSAVNRNTSERGKQNESVVYINVDSTVQNTTRS